MLAQLVFQIAMKVDEVFGMQASKKKKKGDMINFQWNTIDQLLAQDGLELHLAQYVTNCQETFSSLCKDWVFTIATDKGS
eukprot:4338900-Lingulodinium_polyedra.AAC.1